MIIKKIFDFSPVLPFRPRNPPLLPFGILLNVMQINFVEMFTLAFPIISVVKNRGGHALFNQVFTHLAPEKKNAICKLPFWRVFLLNFAQFFLGNYPLCVLHIAAASTAGSTLFIYFRIFRNYFSQLFQTFSQQHFPDYSTIFSIKTGARSVEQRRR